MKSKGIAFADLFDPDVIGDGPTAPGYRVGGVPSRFADIKYGSKRADVKYAEGGVDVSNKWAAKGTAVYALPIDGKTYVENSQTRGGAGVQFDIFANGTYSVTTNNSYRSPRVVVDDTGTWLPAGDAAANWSVQITNAGSGTVIEHSEFTGENTQTTTAATAKSLSSNQNALQQSQANTTGTGATWTGAITIKLYRLGSLRSTTTIHASLNVNGN